MKAVGVIVEYNPFHNGHFYHLKETVKKSNADIVIAVMSGPFMQRGEPALVSKWERTKMALHGGIDLVLELPYPFATQKAETFATGAISILNAMGCQQICFGSESGSAQEFVNTVQWHIKHQQELNKALHPFLKEGFSYPKAMSLAFQAVSDHTPLLDLTKPNNILGFHYVKAIIDKELPINPLTVLRHQANYHDQDFSSEEIASATSIRNSLLEQKNIDLISSYVPKKTLEILQAYLTEFGHFHHWERYWPLLHYRLTQLKPEDLSELYEIEEGIEFRLIDAALKATSFQQFMEQIKTKRYTWSRLQRMCLHILTNTKKKEMNQFGKSPSYMRLLGMSDIGQKYLSIHKKDFALPVISTLSTYKSPDIELDIRASKIYAYGLDYPNAIKLMKTEYSMPPIRISKSR